MDRMELMDYIEPDEDFLMLKHAPAFCLIGGTIGLVAGGLFPDQWYWFYAGLVAFAYGVYGFVKTL